MRHCPKVYRNTWSPGYYDFSAPAASVFTAHNESRFDAFFFGGDFQQVLRLYTTVTGKPFLVPVYGLGLGDSDCYHNERHGNRSPTPTHTHNPHPTHPLTHSPTYRRTPQPFITTPLPPPQ